MLKSLVTALLLLGLTSVTYAQARPSATNPGVGYEFFAGYSVFPDYPVSRVLPQGWEGATTVRFNRFLGAMANFSGHYGKDGLGNPVSIHMAFVGPRGSLPLGRFTPFGGIGLGEARSTNAYGTSYRFEQDLYVGADLQASRSIGIRLIQVEHTRPYFDRTHGLMFSSGITYTLQRGGGHNR